MDKNIKHDKATGSAEHSKKSNGGCKSSDKGNCSTPKAEHKK